jgi:hypothetical protein
MKMLEDSLTDEMRLTVLKLKTAGDEKQLDISSAQIYIAVATKCVKTITALLRLAHGVRIILGTCFVCVVGLMVRASKIEPSISVCSLSQVYPAPISSEMSGFRISEVNPS